METCNCVRNQCRKPKAGISTTGKSKNSPNCAVGSRSFELLRNNVYSTMPKLSELLSKVSEGVKDILVTDKVHDLKGNQVISSNNLV